jgi:hypothetical protein
MHFEQFCMRGIDFKVPFVNELNGKAVKRDSRLGREERGLVKPKGEICFFFTFYMPEIDKSY